MRWTGPLVQLAAAISGFALIVDHPSARAQSPAATTPEFCVACTGPDANYRCTFAQQSGRAVAPGMQLLCISTLAREGAHASCSIARAVTSPCPGALKVLPWPGEAQSDPAPGSPQAATPDLNLPGGRGAEPATAGTAPAPLVPPSDDVEAKVYARPGAAPGAPHTAARPAVTSPVPAASPSPATPTRSDPSAKPVWSDQSGAPSANNGAPRAPAAVQGADPAPQTPPPHEDASPAAKPLDAAGKAVEDAAKSTGSALKKAGDAVSSAAKKSWACLSSLFADCN